MEINQEQNKEEWWLGVLFSHKFLQEKGQKGWLDLEVIKMICQQSWISFEEKGRQKFGTFLSLMVFSMDALLMQNGIRPFPTLRK